MSSPDILSFFISIHKNLLGIEDANRMEKDT